MDFTTSVLVYDNVLGNFDFLNISFFPKHEKMWKTTARHEEQAFVYVQTSYISSYFVTCFLINHILWLKFKIYIGKQSRPWKAYPQPPFLGHRVGLWHMLGGDRISQNAWNRCCHRSFILFLRRMRTLYQLMCYYSVGVYHPSIINKESHKNDPILKVHIKKWC